MRKFGKTFLVFLLSVIIAALVASLLSTQFVVVGLGQAGAEIDWGTRIDMTLYDLGHMGSLYGIIIFLGFGIAFPAAARVHRFAKTKRTLIYVVAGMTCFLVILFLLQTVFFGVQIVAGARTALGITLQALTGGLGGYVFAKLTDGKKMVENT